MVVRVSEAVTQMGPHVLLQRRLCALTLRVGIPFVPHLSNAALTVCSCEGLHSGNSTGPHVLLHGRLSALTLRPGIPFVPHLSTAVPIVHGCVGFHSGNTTGPHVL
jgi:hypothetical protein